MLSGAPGVAPSGRIAMRTRTAAAPGSSTRNLMRGSRPSRTRVGTLKRRMVGLDVDGDP